MKAIVLGAGIVGITTAYELNRDGHEVTVIDREAEPASFTSYANAGLIAPAHSYAWSSPAAPRILIKSLWRNDQALRLKPTLDRGFLSWMWKFWRECTAEKAALNTRRKVRLCELLAVDDARDPEPGADRICRAAGRPHLFLSYARVLRGGGVSRRSSRTWSATYGRSIATRR